MLKHAVHASLCYDVLRLNPQFSPAAHRWKALGSLICWDHSAVRSASGIYFAFKSHKQLIVGMISSRYFEKKLLEVPSRSFNSIPAPLPWQPWIAANPGASSHPPSLVRLAHVHHLEPLCRSRRCAFRRQVVACHSHETCKTSTTPTPASSKLQESNSDNSGMNIPKESSILFRKPLKETPVPTCQPSASTCQLGRVWGSDCFWPTLLEMPLPSSSRPRSLCL